MGETQTETFSPRHPIRDTQSETPNPRHPIRDIQTGENKSQEIKTGKHLNNEFQNRDIKLFVSDIDGCLAMPYQPFRMDRLRTLADFSTQAGKVGSHPQFPSLSICSGRSYPYVEAMSQLLQIQTPVLFESGAGMFDPVSALSSWHPAFTDDIRSEIDDLRRFLEGVALRRLDLSIDYAKRSQAAMVGVPNGSLEEARLEIEEHTSKHHPHFNVFHTHISIDVVPEGLTKAEGMVWLAETCGLKVNELAFIGDTGGDVGAMGVVGAAFAPLNGTPDARAAAHFASDLYDIDAVLEAYESVSGKGS